MNKTIIKFIAPALCSIVMASTFAGINVQAVEQANSTQLTQIAKAPSIDNSLAATSSDTIVYYPTNGNWNAVVTKTDVCFRTHASTSASIIYILPKGATGKWLGGTAGNVWGKVTYKGVTGYINSNYFMCVKG